MPAPFRNSATHPLLHDTPHTPHATHAHGHVAGVAQIEAKLGFLLDKDTRERLYLPISCETEVISSNLTFQSSVPAVRARVVLCVIVCVVVSSCSDSCPCL